MLSRLRVVAIAAATALMVGALVGVASADTENELRTEITMGPVVMKADHVTADELPDAGDCDGEFFVDDELFDEEWELSVEEIAEINAETDALVEYLQDLGFEVTVETDELGITYVDFDKEGEAAADEALFEAVDDFYRQLFADEVAGWSDAEKAEWNAEIDEFVAELEADGITVETEEIGAGVYDIVWTEELEKALWETDGEFFDEFAECDVYEDAEEE
ncbi:MAG: hypothetical protein QNJ75_02305 [Acidimicrobiia bacterium]|nr:hypothetical protein [Acidimicrobiia bacterium]